MQDLTQTFSALSDATRLAVVERLMAEGELPAGNLVAAAEMSAPAMSRHLKVLREAGLVQSRVDGTRRLYSVRAEALQAIADWTLDHRAFWQAGLDRLEAHLALDEKE
ncbi:metalloregulator ArsR/SmtB family transcription factor [Roseovarius sp. CAU 1744]|uniref:ArsR/SmtB family transcription factor n=1 Tax=Roseovarius sp. CAU 1744 TaxID=3140368 RepID=UPI00325B90DE